MADWFVSSATNASIAQFATSHAYSVGDFVKQRGNYATQTITTLTSVTTTATATVTAHGFVVGEFVTISGATQTNYNKIIQVASVIDANNFTYVITATTSPATGSPVVKDGVALANQRVFRCSVAGTSSATTEPNWTLTKAGTTTSGGATFVEVTGNATWGWSAASNRVNPLSSTSWAAAGDRIFVSSDHSESWDITITYGSSNATAALPIKIISVNRAGTVPPVAADITTGAAIIMAAVSGSTFTLNQGCYWEGFTFTSGSGSVANFFQLASTGDTSYFKNCAFVIGHTAASVGVISLSLNTGATILDNCSIQFGATGQSLTNGAGGALVWKNGSIAGSTFPTTLFAATHAESFMSVRGVDLSNLSGTLIPVNAATFFNISFIDCKLNASVTLTSGAMSEQGNYIEFINCDSGATGYKNTYFRYGGSITTETTIVRTGGATDGVQAASHKFVSNAFVSPTLPLEGPALFYPNTTTGTSKTATVEIVSSASLNNNDIWLELEYLGSSGSPIASVANNTVATTLTSGAAQTTSTATWVSSPATPVYQKLQVTFTPQLQGLIRATVKLGKTSTTVYVDPVLTVV